MLGSWLEASKGSSQMYYGEFTCRDDVRGNFKVPDEELGYLLFAAYDLPGYEGYALVVFIRNGRVWVVEGSHCSCHGLEQCWEPEEIPLDHLTKIVNRGGYGMGDYSAELRDALRVVEETGILTKPPEIAAPLLKLFFG